jgi:hypothetical protein
MFRVECWISNGAFPSERLQKRLRLFEVVFEELNELGPDPNSAFLAVDHHDQVRAVHRNLTGDFGDGPTRVPARIISHGMQEAVEQMVLINRSHFALMFNRLRDVPCKVRCQMGLGFAVAGVAGSDFYG